MVITALGVVIAIFLFEVIWPIFEDDAASPLQTAWFAGGLLVVAALAFVSLSGPS